MQTSIRSLALAIIFAVLAGVTRADDKEEVKKLIPGAAAMLRADFEKLAKSPTAPKADDVADKSLTLMLLSLRPPEQPTEGQKAEFAFLTERVPPPSKLAAEIYRGRFSLAPATFIHANRITEITCEVAGDKATGAVSFKVPELYQGKVSYVAQRKETGWQITEFSMPAHGIQVVRGENGMWQEKK
jgi:hypothetical protein